MTTLTPRRLGPSCWFSNTGAAPRDLSLVTQPSKLTVHTIQTALTTIPPADKALLRATTSRASRRSSSSPVEALEAGFECVEPVTQLYAFALDAKADPNRLSLK